MKQICQLDNVIQEYAWGSRTMIADLLGLPSPSEAPQAELWMGAHPQATSGVVTRGERRSLAAEVDASPADTLGTRVSKQFGGRLPFLFKVLAAAEPLSIQAHPTLAQAREGFARENEAGIPVDAPHRNYRDDNHKPEIICALTPFWALNGFRSPDTIAATLGEMEVDEIGSETAALAMEANENGMKAFFSALMTMGASRQRRAVEQAVEFAARRAGQADVWDWTLRLNEKYPGDIGVLSPFILNLLRLEPGEAMLLHAGQLHAYLDGLGIELMANSDNVLRGGLTPKHVDVAELLRVLDFEETRIKILRPGERGAYPSDVGEFSLSVIEAAPDRPYESGSEEGRGIEVMICTDGECTVTGDDGTAMNVRKGVSVVVPAAVASYSIEGAATLYRASVPQGDQL